MITTGGTVDLAEWIIDDTHLVSVCPENAPYAYGMGQFCCQVITRGKDCPTGDIGTTMDWKDPKECCPEKMKQEDCPGEVCKHNDITFDMGRKLNFREQEESYLEL